MKALLAAPTEETGEVERYVLVNYYNFSFCCFIFSIYSDVYSIAAISVSYRGRLLQHP